MLLRDVYTTGRAVIFKLACSYSPSSTELSMGNNEIEALRNKVNI